MAFNLVDAVKGLFTNDIIGRAASTLGESEGGIQKALGAAVPSVLSGILQKAGTTEGASGLLDMAKQATGSGILSKLGGLISGAGSSATSSLMNMASGLFGDKLSGITSMISNFAGIKSSSAASLVSMAAPAALGAIGKYANENNLGVSGLSSFLASQKNSILSAVPSGLNIAGALGLGSLSDIGHRLTSMVSGAGTSVAHAAGNMAEKAGSGMKWLLPVLLAVLAFAFVLYLIKGCGASKNEAVVTPVDTTSKAAPAETPAVTAPTRESLKVKLPDGTELDAYKGGIEDQLVAFLNDPNSKPGKDVWFDFDDLNFETGSASITPSSQKQINNIAAILKAYSKVKIKIGGYTDKTGDSATNKKLSQDRADATVAAIKSAGAKAAQLTGAEGYGSQFAKADATAPDEERRKDRRIAVSVREK